MDPTSPDPLLLFIDLVCTTDRTMRTMNMLLIIPVLIIPVFTGTLCDRSVQAVVAAAAQPDIDHFQLEQSTCALYVAVRSSSLGSPLAFGTVLGAEGIRTNLCPALEVACRMVPEANDTAPTE